MTFLRRTPRHPLTLVGLACLAPYAALLAYLAYEHRAADVLHRPRDVFFGSLALVGGLLPLGVSLLVFVRMVRDTTRFRAVVLIELYVGLLLAFASLYAVVQVAGVDPAFSSMPTLWDDAGHDFDGHRQRLHGVFGSSLYLSVMTMTTVGYGDIVPMSGLARLATAAQALVGVSFVGVSVGHYFAVCSRRR